MWCTPCRYGVYAKTSIKPILVCRATSKSFILNHQGEIPGGIFMPERRWFS
nr:MAG TPA: NADH-ubiquinone oxidoreductase [Caudoviricetes sp.]